MKKREMEESQDEEEEEAKQVTSVHVLRAQSSNANSNVIQQQETATENVNTVSQPTSTDTAKQSYHPHESNPFSKMNNNTSQNLTVTNTGTNPFFKSTSQETKIDPHKAEAQRASQRGVASSGGWSDSEEEESEEESPNRAGAAKLASLLFGGMPQPPTTSSSSLNNDAEKVSEQEHENAKQVASTPLSNDDNGKTDSGPSGFAGENELSFSQAPPIPVDAPPAPNSIPPPPPLLHNFRMKHHLCQILFHLHHHLLLYQVLYLHYQIQCHRHHLHLHLLLPQITLHHLNRLQVHQILVHC